LVLEVIEPLLRFEPAGKRRFPAFWQEGQTIYGRTYLFGMLPVGVHTVHFERIDARQRQIQTREIDPLVNRWDHLLEVGETPDGRTHYADEIDVEAGGLTFFVWLYAQFFFRHRQRRWRRVLGRLLAESPAERRTRPIAAFK